MLVIPLSGRWMNERRRDHYYRRAREEGYRSRSAFKLKQIDTRFNIFKGKNEKWKKNTGVGEVEKYLNKIGYSNLIGKQREERLACFVPLLHLSNTKKLWLEQENHLEEIWIYLYEYFNKNQDLFIEELEEDIEEMKEELREMDNIDEAKLERIEKMKKKREEKKQMSEDIAKELESELGIINKDEKIDSITGFDSEEMWKWK